MMVNDRDQWKSRFLFFTQYITYQSSSILQILSKSATLQPIFKPEDNPLPWDLFVA